MSLDETHEALSAFRLELERFNDLLRVSQAELRERHEEIDALWQDNLRRNYDIAIGELERNVSDYDSCRSEMFEEFIQRKLNQLQRYLHGD